jgi:hypothetical protein
MALFEWLKSLAGHQRQVLLESVSFDEHGVTSRHPDSTAECFPWADLQWIEILTTDEGPWAEDVYLVLHGHETDCIIPESSDGFDTLLMHLQKFPHFDSEAIIQAMNCTENSRFLCWTADDA